MNTNGRALGCALAGVLFGSLVCAQTPFDLFSDVAPLGAGYLRLASWNLEHIDTMGEDRDFLPGADRDADNDIKAATFAKAVRDLGLDVLFVVENQPRNNEENRIEQIRGFLNQGVTGAPWRSDESHIEYGANSQPVDSGDFGGLQFAVIWNSARVQIDPASDMLLLQLRQSNTLRAPWQVPVTAGALQFDVIVLHLKSGGVSPQQAEVNALAAELESRLRQPGARHTIVCGDWNVRPDIDAQAARLRQLEIPFQGNRLMRILTIEQTRLSFEDWDAIGQLNGTAAISKVVPFTHYNPASPDTFLDHLAISSTLSEVFDNPVTVDLANGGKDVVPGFQIAVPAVPESVYFHFTDHLPIVLTLRTSIAAPPPPPALPALTLVSALPNPIGDDGQLEEVRLRNNGSIVVNLTGWTLRDASGTAWVLNAGDGSVDPGATRAVVRRGRPMTLNNQGGETIQLFDPAGTQMDEKSYTGTIGSGQVVNF